jgi:cytochrome c-type biogenesis protein CcmE
MKNNIKYLISFLIILGVLIYLVSTTFQSSLQYYVTVSELQAKESDYQDKTLKVAGVARNIQRTDGEYESKFDFTVVEGGKDLQVYFSGLVPDTFKDGSDVVVTGHLTPDGRFEADEILAKCASKYEAKIEE